MTATDAQTRGTYTYLFSDIELSTQLESDVGRERYAAVRERHRAILRDVWAAHDGREQVTEGDSFFVVFAEAPAAVEAAVDGQRRLAAEPWPDDAAIRVRMGVHVGRGELDADGSYVGHDVHRAARIEAAAHGGQVLLSEAASDLVERPAGSVPATASRAASERSTWPPCAAASIRAARCTS